MRKRISEEKAAEIAVLALTFLASNEEEMYRFLNLTGMAAENLRDSASNPGFLVAVLDYLLGFEPTLLRFAEEIKTDPQYVVDARHILAGPEEAW